LTILDELPRWFTVIVVSRDVILIGGALILYMFVGKMSMPPSWLGKTTTGFQIATVLLGMIDNFLPVLRAGILPVAVLTAVLTIGSGLDYVFRGARLLND
jgi:phosphatidylglycerophosphate synthase